MATMDLTAYDAVLKDYYTPDKMKELSMADNPFYAMVPKKRAGGRRYVQPIEFGKPGNASADFATAMLNASRSRFEDFLITRKKQYQRVMVDHETLLSSDDPAAAFQPAFEEFDRGFKGVGEKIARRIVRRSSGSIGKMANSVVSNSTITLADKADAFNFQVEDVVAFSSTDGGGSLRSSGATNVISEVDYEAGTLTVATQLDTAVPAIGTTDYIFPAGDHDACLAGLEDWLPVDDRSTKLAASFFGVTRSVNAARLGGVYLDGTTVGGIDEILIRLVNKVAKHGGRTSHVFMNPETLGDLQALWNNKHTVVQQLSTTVRDGEARIGFAGFQINIGGGNVKVYGDRNWPSNRIHALQMDTWKLWHSGDVVNFLGEKFTGKILKLAESEDSLEARVGTYCNLGCSAPGWNGVAQIPVST